MPSVFLHRAPGDAAAVIGGVTAQAEQATHARLQTADGGVLVKGILRQADGSFIGEVYGVTPRQQAVGVGDLVTFVEAQVFTFKVDVNSSPAADAETADMIRVFEAGFVEAEAPAQVIQPIHLDGLDAHFSPAEGVEAKTVPTEQHAATVPSRSDDFRSASKAPLDRIEQEPGSAEAVSPLKTAEGPKPDLKQERTEPTGVANTRLPQAAVANEHQVTCVECGAIVRFSRMPHDPPVARELRVTCRNCGRINDIAAAQLASRK